MPSQFFERPERLITVDVPVIVLNDLEVEEEEEWDRNCRHLYPSDNYVYALSGLEAGAPYGELQRRKSFDSGERRLR